MKKIIIILAAVLVLFSSCAYDDYKSDFETSKAYFAYQYPLRTLLVDPDASQMLFKTGIPLTGKYDGSDKIETAHYIIADTLVTNHPEYNIKIMPHDWYNYEDIKDGSFVIKKGETQGSVEIKINKEKFTSDSLSHLNTYAIPLLLIGETTLSGGVMPEKNFTIVVVKYVNEYDGLYYMKGVDEVEKNGTVEEEVYGLPHLVENDKRNVTTFSKNSVVVPRAGSNLSDSIIIQKETSDLFTIKALPSSNIVDVAGTSTFKIDSETGIKTFINEYSFKDGADLHNVKDTLIIVDPDREREFNLEQWK